jgi:high-affinity iron transporter
VQNLFDQTYFTGNNNAVYPGEPRTAFVRLRERRPAMRSATPLALVAFIVGAGGLVACDPGPDPSLDAGKDLYRQNGCASCHGPEGHGDGPVAKTLTARPRDFRDTSAFKQGTDVASIADTIATGVVELTQGNWPGGEHHHQVMPQFSHLSEWERRSLALYVISLRSSAGTRRSQP